MLIDERAVDVLVLRDDETRLMAEECFRARKFSTEALDFVWDGALLGIVGASSPERDWLGAPK